MCKEELDLYLSGNIKDVGRSFSNPKLSNNHRYKNGEKYVHMFKDIKDLKLVQEQRNFEYLATFDIPMFTLMISFGKGLYSNIKNGKIQSKYIKEFAINTKRMKPEYFIGYEKVKKFEYNIDELLKLFKNATPITSMEDFTNIK